MSLPWFLLRASPMVLTGGLCSLVFAVRQPLGREGRDIRIDPLLPPLLNPRSRGREVLGLTKVDLKPLGNSIDLAL